MPKTLPTEWTDERTGYESLYDSSVAEHFMQARLGCNVTVWTDGRITWTTTRADGSVRSGEAHDLVLAFQDAEMATGRFITIPAGPFA